MPASARSRLVNPRLGTFYGIFVSAFTALALLALIAEQLGASDLAVRAFYLIGLTGLYLAMAALAFTDQPAEYYASGRRVPAFFNGLALAIAAVGGAGLVGITGSLFLIGIDALCLVLGWSVGLVVMAVLLAPYIRKAGSYTLPGYLGRRFDSGLVRLLAAAVMTVPLLLILVAEVQVGSVAVSWLSDLPRGLAVHLVLATATAIVVSGGMRAQTWSAAAKGMVAILALAVTATIVSLLLTNLPIPQMTQGNILRNLARLEITRGAPAVYASPWTVELPGDGLETIAKRYLQSFGSIGSMAFPLLTLTVVVGLAASPMLLPRAGTSPGVHEMRKSLGWAVLVVGFALLTRSATAIFLRAFVVDQVAGAGGDKLPVWFQRLKQLDLADAASKTRVLAIDGLSFRRDGVLIALPIAAGLPQAVVGLVLSGILAAALAGSAAAIMALGAILSRDVLGARVRGQGEDGRHLALARGSAVGVALAVAALALVPADPLRLLLWSLILSGSSGFAVLFLSVWWKRINTWGAAAGMLAGFASAVLLILMCELGILPLSSLLASTIAVPLSAAAAVGISQVTPVPSRSVLEMARDIRIPGGETLHDRQRRLARLYRRERPT